MKATLTKNIKVKTAIAYLIFEKEQERQDIVEFLNGDGFEDKTINNRVSEYLKKIGVLGNDNTITNKGERVRETGKIFVQEEGKYKFWYVENDSFINTKILSFERLSPQKDENVKEINIDFSEENFFLPINNYEFSLLKLVNTDNISGKLISNSENIRLVWKWRNLENSKYYFTGKIDNQTVKDHSIECDENLEEYIMNIIPNWDFNNQKLKVEFRDLTNDDDRQRFKSNFMKGNHEGFNSVEITDISIMPHNIEDAIVWRNWFVNKEIENNYFLKYDFEILVKSANNRNGFSFYKKDLDIPELSMYRNDLYNKDRSKQKTAFWHLSAPNDLNPDTDQKYIVNSLNYAISKKISFSDIVCELIENSKNNVNAVFYYDKYTSSFTQQKSLIAFLNSFNIEDNNKYLISILNLKDQKKRNQYLAQNSSIQVIDANNVFQNKLAHNRYIIIAESKEKYTVWQLPSSIDYIKFIDKDVEPKTVGVIKDSISFNQVEKEMLKEELRTFIENKL